MIERNQKLSSFPENTPHKKGFFEKLHDGSKVDKSLIVAAYASSIISKETEIEMITSHGHDVTAPIALYALDKIFKPHHSPSDRAMFVWSIFATGEIAQRLHLYPGTFDPKDFLAYGVGVGLSYGVEKLRERNGHTTEETIIFANDTSDTTN